MNFLVNCVDLRCRQLYFSKTITGSSSVSVHFSQSQTHCRILLCADFHFIKWCGECVYSFVSSCCCCWWRLSPPALSLEYIFTPPVTHSNLLQINSPASSSLSIQLCSPPPLLDNRMWATTIAMCPPYTNHSREAAGHQMRTIQLPCMEISQSMSICSRRIDLSPTHWL